MRKFKYVGPHDEVEVPSLGVVVKRGATVEVEDPDVSAGLDGQDVWEHVPDRKRSQAAKKAAKTAASSSATEQQAEPAADVAADDSQEG